MIALALACVPVVIWLYLLFARGNFWRVARQLAPLPPDPHVAKSVIAVIPARNEAAGIAETVTSVLSQNFAGPIHVIVVDDESTDGTAQIATNAAAAIGLSNHLTVIRGNPRPAGWTGKVWAMAQGVEAALAQARGTQIALTRSQGIQDTLARTQGSNIGSTTTRETDAASTIPRRAEALALPDYLLFTDADIQHEPNSVASLVANAEAFDRDLVSVLV